jgi:hypothetical protein
VQEASLLQKENLKCIHRAYANAYASKICAGKIKDPSGTKEKRLGTKESFLRWFI